MRELLFGATFLVATIGAAVDVWGYDWFGYYSSFARDAHLDRGAFHFRDGDRAVTLAALLDVDRATRAYVVCGCATRDDLAAMQRFFDANELAHLDDVRRVYAGVQTSAILAGVIAAATALGLSRRRLRRTLLADAAAVVVIGAVAAVAFEPLFLAFHQIFFPQGNFLFDPARENLTLVYPEEYWLGVTLRLGATLIAVFLLVGGILSVPIGSNAVMRPSERIVV